LLGIRCPVCLLVSRARSLRLARQLRPLSGLASLFTMKSSGLIIHAVMFVSSLTFLPPFLVFSVSMGVEKFFGCDGAGSVCVFGYVGCWVGVWCAVWCVLFALLMLVSVTFYVG